MIFVDSVNENSGLQKKYIELWDEIKIKIKSINGGKEISYEKDYTQINFNSNDNLPLNKPLKLLDLFLKKIMIQLDRTEDSEGIDLDKTDISKEFKLCYYNCFENGIKSDSKT